MFLLLCSVSLLSFLFRLMIASDDETLYFSHYFDCCLVLCEFYFCFSLKSEYLFTIRFIFRLLIVYCLLFF